MFTILPAFLPFTQVVSIVHLKGWWWSPVFPPQLLSQPSSGSRVHRKGLSFIGRIKPWNYWKSCWEVWKIICRIFSLSYQEIRSSQQSTSLFSALKSTYRKLVLNPAAEEKLPFIFNLFSFLPERQKRVGFYVHQTRTGLFLQCIRLRSPPPHMNAYLDFHQKKIK